MGTRIEAVATSRSRERPFAKGALKLADQAAKACLRRAGRRPGELDLLINAGIYRGKCLEEPALAALIQEDIDANRGHPPPMGHQGTFSFDVHNSGCGALTAMHLIDGFLRSGAVELGMVVASDVDPDRGVSRGYPFRRTGGALLLGWDEGADHRGFTDFHFETWPEYEDLFTSRLRWEQRRGWPRRRGRNVLTVTQRDGYIDRCADCAETTTRRFLRRAGLAAEDLDLVVPSQFPIGFPDEIGDRLAIPNDRVAQVSEEFEGAHTAGPLGALEAAAKSGQLAEARDVLFVTVGAGITVGVALYRKPGDRPGRTLKKRRPSAGRTEPAGSEDER